MKTIDLLIEDIRNRLFQSQQQSEWYHQQFKKYEKDVLELKEFLTFLKEMKIQ